MSQMPEDDRTVLSSGGVRAPANDSEPGRANALAVGTRLGEFDITGILGEGGFGIVYLAYDNSLERQVALKEYMPSFAWRATQAHVSVRSSQNADSFEAGLRSFINEARLLAQFDHPSLVKVYRFWEANGTAYMVMPYYHGSTLKQVLRERTVAPDETWLKALLAPLLDALDVIHHHQCFHRDIAPDNILMLDEGRPLLLDFGAARRAIGGLNQAFTVILKQNYAPIEQYAEMPGMSQGAWTDLYALASVVHFAIDGHAPPPAVSRMLSDPYVPLATRYADRYSQHFLQAIDRALAFKPEDRPQSVAAMRSLLDLDREAPREQPTPPLALSAPPMQAPPWLAPEKPAAPRRGKLVAAIAALTIGAAGVFTYLNQPNQQPVAASPARAAAANPDRPPAPVPAAPPAVPVFDPVATFDAVLAGASAERKVTVELPGSRVRIGEKIGFSIRSSHAGHVYIHMVGSAGNDFHLLFPNALDGNNRIGAGQVLALPRSTWPIKAYGPPGTDHFVVIVSDAPRDFDAAGLVDGNPFASFSIERAAQLQAGPLGKSAAFAGTPDCTDAPCSPLYGAARFSIDEVGD